MIDNYSSRTKYRTELKVSKTFLFAYKSSSKRVPLENTPEALVSTTVQLSKVFWFILEWVSDLYVEMLKCFTGDFSPNTWHSGAANWSLELELPDKALVQAEGLIKTFIRTYLSYLCFPALLGIATRNRVIDCMNQSSVFITRVDQKILTRHSWFYIRRAVLAFSSQKCHSLSRTTNRSFVLSNNL